MSRENPLENKEKRERRLGLEMKRQLDGHPKRFVTEKRLTFPFPTTIPRTTIIKGIYL